MEELNEYYSSCIDQCTYDHSTCTSKSNKINSFNGITTFTCKCCRCSIDYTDTDSSTPDTNTDTNNGCGTTTLDTYYYSSCNEQCTNDYGSCGTINSNSDGYSTTCTCCACGDSASSGASGSNGCETETDGEVENPLQEKSEIVYVFLVLFLIICIFPLWYFAYRYSVKDDSKCTISVCGLLNKYFDIIDDNGRKYKFCGYWKNQHSITTLTPCVTTKNIYLVWAAFVFDNAVAFSMAILFASISASYTSTNCNYSRYIISSVYNLLISF